MKNKMKELIIVGADVGIASRVANMAKIHSLADTVIVVDELQKQKIKKIELTEQDYYEFDHLTRKKKPASKEWQRRIKNLQNSRK